MAMAMKSALLKAKASSPIVQALPDSFDDDEDMEELIMLASGKVNGVDRSSAVQYQEPSLLKSAKLAGMIEEGRVLVKGPSEGIEPSPTHNLNETNFEAPMHEALNRIGIQKPKLIQAHVWEPILR